MQTDLVEGPVQVPCRIRTKSIRCLLYADLVARGINSIDVKLGNASWPVLVAVMKVGVRA